MRLFSDLGTVSGSFPMRIEDDFDLINSLRLQTRDRAAPQDNIVPAENWQEVWIDPSGEQ